MPRPVLYMDLRRPDFVVQSRSELYATALEMFSWCDDHGWFGVFLNEHHSADDGYLPAPVTMAAAVAARTKHLDLRLLLLAPFYDPLRLAEDLAVVDLISAGRVTPVLAAGYRPTEFDMFGVNPREKRVRLEEVIQVLRQAWTGEPFRYRGRTVRVRPTPHRDGGPPILMGGSTKLAARHAARVADGFHGRGDVLWNAYRQECLRLGRPDPGEYRQTAPAFLLVTEDPESALNQVWRNIVAWNNSYNEWFMETYNRLWGPPLETQEDVRANSDLYRILTPDETFKLASSLGPEDFLAFRPLCGGMDPGVSWQSLQLFVDKVQPRLEAVSASMEG
jgi:alkanesulfonate monooxygenase SsuD/methylene tetrahydromethanopterin reductase-like flavin-dependent oxidoreductase (luciferase family)